MTDIVHARDKGVELFETADGPVFVAIDRGFPCGFRARGGERLGSERLRVSFAAPLPRARCAPSPACGGGRGGGASTGEEIATLIEEAPTRIAARSDLPRKRER